MKLFLHYFKHRNDIRRKEITYCVKHNINNKNFDKIYLLMENSSDKEDWMIKDNVVIVNVNNRMNFRDIFEYSNGVDNDDINMICNLDIFTDDTISKLKEHNIDNHFITLTRWNIDIKTKQANHFGINCSQDFWIWKGKVDLNKFDLNYSLGLAGCDNAICGEFHEAGYKVINPSLDLKSYHLHQETKRDYTDDDVVRKRLYLLYPTQDWDRSLIQYWKDCTNYKPSK
jgi:hypothetical protein